MFETMGVVNVRHLYRTYEELKHEVKKVFDQKFAVYLYRTYEELKLRLQPINRSNRLNNLYRTYEELKHVPHVHKS